MTFYKNINSLQDGMKCFWMVKDFIMCKQNKGLKLKSPNFEVDMLMKSEWHLETEIFASNFDAYLYKNKGLSLNTSIQYSIYLFTRRGWKILKNDVQCKMKSEGSGHGIDALQWDKISNHLIICFHLWNGSTQKDAQCVLGSEMKNEKEIIHLPVIECSNLTPQKFSSSYRRWFLRSDTKCETYDKSIQTNVAEDSNKFNDLEDLIRLFKEKKFRYVILRTRSKEFAVQKALLCARSPVFNAMFDRDMKENESNMVDIEDIDNDTLSLLLQFLHLEPLGNLKWDSAVKLFYAADKYQIMPLKKECILNLKKELTEENVCDAIVLADMHNEEELMQSAVEFFCKKSKSIIRSPAWKNLTLCRTELASEILCKMAEMLLS